MTNSYRTQGAADYLGVSKSFLDKQAAKGAGPAYRKPGRIRIYDEPDLDDYKRATRVEPKNVKAESAAATTLENA
jgi:excisionase family DNA binding protein